MIVLLEQRSGLALRRASWSERLRARIGASALDRQLAVGRSPAGSAVLALRAEHLAQPRRCRVLAESLRRLSDMASGTAGPDAMADDPGGDPARRGSRRLARVPVAHAALAEARAELRAVADRLTAPSPPGVQGLALIVLLLSDGAGPLYRTSPDQPLGAALRRVREGLDTFS